MAEIPAITIEQLRAELEAAEFDIERYLELAGDGFTDLEFGFVVQRRDVARKRYAAAKSQEPQRRPFAGRA